MSDDLLAQALEAVRSRREHARALGIELVGVVGSVARGEARTDSDVDVLYEIVGRPTLFDLGGILMELQDALGRRVDLVDRNIPKPRLRAAFERELVTA